MGEVHQLPQPGAQPDEILTRREMKDKYKVSFRTIDRWVKEGCPSERWGLRVRRFRVGRVERWLQNREAA